MPKVTIYKYKETETFHFHNANPKGKNASDCVYRAVSVGLNQDYAQTMREMCEMALKIGYAPNDTQTIKKYLESKGWTTYKEPRDNENKKIPAKRFCALNPKGTIIANIGSHHTSLIIDGRIWDTWDCSKKPIHIYWRKV